MDPITEDPLLEQREDDAGEEEGEEEFFDAEDHGVEVTELVDVSPLSEDDDVPCEDEQDSSPHNHEDGSSQQGSLPFTDE